MFRRTFLISTSALGLAACGGGPTETPTDRASHAELEIVVIDAQTPFGSTGKPYLNALRDAELLRRSGVSALELPDYGREMGAIVKDSVVFVADTRERLEEFFDSLPASWQLPESHELRFGQDRWPDGSGPLQWGARVVRISPAVTRANVIHVEADPDGVWIHLDRSGAGHFEAMTAANVGQRLAIVVDDEIRADPVVNAPIRLGQVRITLEGGLEAHRALARRLQAPPPPSGSGRLG